MCLCVRYTGCVLYLGVHCTLCVYTLTCIVYAQVHHDPQCCTHGHRYSHTPTHIPMLLSIRMALACYPLRQCPCNLCPWQCLCQLIYGSPRLRLPLPVAVLLLMPCASCTRCCCHAMPLLLLLLPTALQCHCYHMHCVLASTCALSAPAYQCSLTDTVVSVQYILESSSMSIPIQNLFNLWLIHIVTPILISCMSVISITSHSRMLTAVCHREYGIGRHTSII